MPLMISSPLLFQKNILNTYAFNEENKRRLGNNIINDKDSETVFTAELNQVVMISDREE